MEFWQSLFGLIMKPGTYLLLLIFEVSILPLSNLPVSQPDPTGVVDTRDK